MGKNEKNRWVNTGLLIAAAFQAASGLILLYGLPRGPGFRGRFGGISCLGLGRGDWINLHTWLAVAIGILAAFHIVLHWKWIKVNIFRIRDFKE